MHILYIKHKSQQQITSTIAAICDEPSNWRAQSEHRSGASSEENEDRGKHLEFRELELDNCDLLQEDNVSHIVKLQVLYKTEGSAKTTYHVHTGQILLMHACHSQVTK